jgi:hypothetical protein
MSTTDPLVHGIDVPIVRLVPRHERSVKKTQLKRIEASLRSVGLIEPLIVYPDGENYEILDVCLRYRILLEMGVESVPCLVNPTRDGFTANRMVNQLSASQEMRMLRQSLEELDEKTIANALGFAGIGHRLNKGLMQKLDPLVAKAFAGALRWASFWRPTCRPGLARIRWGRREFAPRRGGGCEKRRVFDGFWRKIFFRVGEISPARSRWAAGLMGGRE